MKWIAFFQTYHGRVRYTTNELYPDFTSMSYDAFIAYLFKYFKLANVQALIDTLDRFETIYLDNKTGVWEKVIKPYKREDYTFEQLLKHNTPKEESNTVFNRAFSQSRKSYDRFKKMFKNKKDDTKNIYSRKRRKNIQLSGF